MTTYLYADIQPTGAQTEPNPSIVSRAERSKPVDLSGDRES